MGARRILYALRPASFSFQSTRPAWGATIDLDFQTIAAIFQSTRPAWGATAASIARCTSSRISIHAPRVGRDICTANRTHNINISIHAPRVGRDRNFMCIKIPVQHFNPRAPCGARLVTVDKTTGEVEFQSTRPVWGATQSFRPPSIPHIISIHAPRVGRDEAAGQADACARNFNPRAPRGARRSCIIITYYYDIFQSTRPAWGATFTFRLYPGKYWISIHAPRVGRDWQLNTLA